MVTLADARTTLTRYFGYPDFRPGQVDVVRSVVEGRDTLGVLPTGGGKSLCYQVPALVLRGLTVVVSPLISLMKDQVDRLRQRGVAATFLNSTLDPEEARARLDEVRSGRLTLLYVAPERLESPDLQSLLARLDIALLAVDEAHCISEWGHEFRPSFRRIAGSCESLRVPQRMAVTATATPAVRRDIVRQLRMRDPRIVVSGFDRANLSYAVRRCRDDEDKVRVLIEVVRGGDRPAIVYASTRASVERVARRLRRAGKSAAAYHGGLPPRDRLEIQEEFMAGRVECLVATNAFGMGIDKPDVRLVAHFAMPGTLEAYYQEAGRAGRDGQPGRCVLVHGPGDRGTHEYFLRSMLPDADRIRQVYDRLRRTHVNGHAFPDPSDAPVIRFLADAAVLHRRPVDRGRVRVRLLATEARVARELSGGSPERTVMDRITRMSRPHAGPAGVEVRLSDARGPLAMSECRAALDRLTAGRFVHVQPVGGGVILARPDAPLADFALPWEALARRAAAELARLDMMCGYVTTRSCRRAYVLRYFGERVSETRCHGCDNCLRN